MNTLRTTHLATTLVLAMLFAQAQTVEAQINEQIWTGAAGVALDWNGATWSPVGSPPDESFNEIAVINNGGIAFLSSPADEPTGGLLLGRFDDPSGLEGTLEVRNGGSLTIVNNGTTQGQLLVGTFDGGGITGTLDIQSGGSVTTSFMDIRGGDSSATLSGTASLDATLINVSNDLRLNGPNVAVNTGTLQLFGGGTLVAGITGTTHAAINVNGLARLGGNVQLDFSGHTPVVGNSWTLINAGGVAGNFGTQIVNSNASLNPGEAFILSKSSTQVDVSLERVLTLQVNRDSGAVSIDNDSSASLGFSAYSVRSDSGLLNSGAWQSLASGPFSSFQEANPSVNQLGEINPAAPTGDASFASSSSQSLGSVYTKPTAPFGTALNDDLEFSYQRDSDGKTITGLVEYTGTLLANNLILSIDPASGNAVVKNDSDTSLNIDSYTIDSDSNSLLTSWNSLADQGETGWTEASPTTDRVSELNPTSALTLNPGETFTLNGLWNTGGLQDISDLGFQFRDTALGTFDGIIEFASAGAADADGDGDVDGADFLALQRDNPASIPQWEAAYPSGALASSVATVPEPMALSLIATCLAACACQRRTQKEVRS